MDDKQESPKPIPFSEYLDIGLSLLFPLIGLSFVLLTLFWLAIRPSVPETAVQSWVIGIIAAKERKRHAMFWPRPVGFQSCGCARL
jgi:hypothetical protein